MVVERVEVSLGQNIDSYRVDKLLGEGAFGMVFRVSDPSSRVYALKILKLWEVHPEIRESLVARFEMEYQTGRIESPYLVHSLDCGFIKGNPYILMEFCSGGDLMSIDKHSADWPKIARQILLGLKALHSCGKVHRDLKPENVLIKNDGVAALTDFGISGDRTKRMTERNIWGKPQQIFGTYAYMPPEQVNPQRDATVLPTTDIFSFGVMMYQLLTNKLPFGPLETEEDLARYIRAAKENRWEMSALHSTNQGRLFLPIIQRCLHPDYHKRIQSVDEVLNMLPGDGNKPEQVAPALRVPETIRGYLLRVMQGEDYGREYNLTQLSQNRGVLTMGRSCMGVNNAVAITETQSVYISRMHCTLECEEKNWYIRDGQWDRNSNGGWKSSTNGTYVNAKQVGKEGFCLSIGDIVSIGDAKLRLEAY